MTELRDVLGYFITHYYRPRRAISEARLTRLVYLADWKAAIERDKQITHIVWYYNHFGPYVGDVRKLVYEDEHFNVEEQTSKRTGAPKEMVSIKKSFEFTSLSLDDIIILKHVISSTNYLPWLEFMQLVYSTFPVLTGKKYTALDLVALARRYKDHLRRSLSDISSGRRPSPPRSGAS